jgi:hypothetical protein
MRCSAAFSWRLPTRERRWRCQAPEEHSNGATPACIAKAASERNRPTPATSAMILAAVGWVVAPPGGPGGGGEGGCGEDDEDGPSHWVTPCSGGCRGWGGRRCSGWLPSTSSSRGVRPASLRPAGKPTPRSRRPRRANPRRADCRSTRWDRWCSRWSGARRGSRSARRARCGPDESTQGSAHHRTSGRNGPTRRGRQPGQRRRRPHAAVPCPARRP